MADPRVDEHGRAHKGSQGQVQTWVNEHPGRAERGDSGRTARGSPHSRPKLRADVAIARAGLPRVHQRGVPRAGRPRQAVSKLAEFWPSGGPEWDGLAVYQEPTGKPGVVLVEGRAIPRSCMETVARPATRALKRVACPA